MGSSTTRSTTHEPRGWQRHTDPARVVTVRHPLPSHLRHLHGTRIVQVSDLHVGPFFRAETWARHIEVIRELDPDVVVITGDAMDWSRRYTADYIEPLSTLQARYGALAVLGNHDFYFGARRLTSLYAQSGQVKLLRGERWSTDALPGLSFWGIDDPMTSLVQRANYAQLEAFRTQMEPGGYHILLSHRPDAFIEASALGFNLQLSGHTHGGQIQVSTVFGKLHVSRVMGPYDQGTFTRRTARGTARLYVNRGLGYAAVPFRLDCHTEITKHVLHCEAPSSRLARGGDAASSS